jgi:GNAT superfamily N-acetyltransferase
LTAELPGSIEPLSIIRAIERNLGEWYRALVRLIPGAEIYEEADLTRTLVPIPHPLFSAMFGAQLAHGTTIRRIGEAMAPLIERRRPAMWWIGPSTHPVDLADRLVARGFSQTDTLAGMALDLLQGIPPADRDAEHAADFSVDEATRAAELAAWSLPFGEGFGMRPETLAALAPVSEAVQRDGSGPMRFFLGRSGGRAVSSAMLFLGAGVAGLYGVATVSRARNRGFASAIVNAAILSAREAGYRVCILHASPMAVSVYRRLGFVEYCRLRTLTWTPPAEGVPSNPS